MFIGKDQGIVGKPILPPLQLNWANLFARVFMVRRKPLPREKSKRTLEIELSLVIGQSYNQCYASEHRMVKLCLCGVGLLIATVRNTKKLLFYDFLLFWKK